MTKSEVRARYAWAVVILGILILWTGLWPGIAIFGVILSGLLLSAYGRTLQSRNGASSWAKFLERAGFALAMAVLIGLLVIAVLGGGHGGPWVVRP